MSKEKNPMSDSKYPEHEKMEKFKLTTPDGTQTAYPQVIGEFVEWLESQGMCIADNTTADLVPTPMTLDTMLCAFMGVNSQKVEEERRAMIRETQEVDNE